MPSSLLLTSLTRPKDPWDKSDKYLLLGFWEIHSSLLTLLIYFSSITLPLLYSIKINNSINVVNINCILIMWHIKVDTILIQLKNLHLSNWINKFNPILIVLIKTSAFYRLQLILINLDLLSWNRQILFFCILKITHLALSLIIIKSTFATIILIKSSFINRRTFHYFHSLFIQLL